MGGALTGLKVVELAAIGPVPLAGMILADMGAEVVRVDRIPKDPNAPSMYSTFDSRGRRSVAIDLKQAEGIDTVLRLVEGCDVLLEGFRPGVLEKLGLGPDVCLVRNPRIVIGRMTGWGQSGPLASSAGHDLNYIALTGALHAMGTPDRPPSPPLNLVGDYGGGAMMLVTGILAALYERQRSAKGQVIDAAMTDGVLALMAPLYAMLEQGLWSDQRASNLLDGAAHFYGVYECADGGYVSIGSIEPQFYDLLLKCLGLEGDPDFKAQMSKANWPQLRQRLDAIFRTKPRSEWCALMEGTDVCFAPVLSMDEAKTHSHHQARKSFVNVNGVVQPAPAPRFSRTPSQASARIPHEGQDSREVLADAGMSEAEIANLLRSGAVYAATRGAG